VYDSDWLKGFSDDMVKKSGVRVMSFADNGVRHFTNSKRPVRTPEDMKGLKMRVMPSPVFQTLVNALGASPSAIPWAELPTALQQKVVDGQENGVTNILAASLYQYQKYITLDGHVWSVHGYTINEKYYQGLTAAERKAVDEGTQKATAIHRKMTSDQDKNAKEILTKLGMEVTEIGPAELAKFRQLAQPPVKAWAEKEIGKEYVDNLFKAIEATRK
jgi:C4-dicarboxylate-binding protein DctP